MFTARSLRPISGTTLFFFLWMALYPAVSAAIGQDQATPPAAQAAQPSEPDTLDSLRELAGRAHAKADRGEDESDEAKQLLDQADKLDTEEQQAEAEFAQTRKHLEDHHLPDEIKQRHAEALAGYRAKMKQLKQLAQGFKAAHGRKDKAAARQQLKAMADFLVKEQKHRQHQPFDPKHLPFGTPDGNVRAPKESKQELDDLVRPPQAVAVAANELLPGMLAQNDPGATPTADDLAATEDAPLTDAIKTQAAALHHNPVEIYNWVRNSVEFLPTYGSIQGSDLTLQTLRGNAFDTASLLVALLRASNIPARYAYGTIQVPAAQVMNWVGGVKTPEAAQSLLGQGGIPTVGMVAKGKITAFKLEHVWVEAFVDYIPSRGAINKVGDSWVPLDAAFKQYQYSDGMDIKTAVPLDAQSLADQIQAGATVNENEGWVQNLNGTALQTALTDYQSQVQAYIDNQKPNATVGDVLGVKKIVEQKYPVLMGSLPYTTIVKAGAFGNLPDKFRHYFRLKLFSTVLDRASDSPSLSYSISFPKISSHRIGLSFVPSSDNDAQVLQSYRGQANSNEFPVYLIHVQPVLQLDGQTLATGGSIMMGSDQYWETSFSSPNTTNPYSHTYEITAGDEVVFSVNGNGLTPSVIQARANAVDSDTASENLHQAALHYWVVNDGLDKSIAQSQGLVNQRTPSTGLFSSPLTVKYAFGLPRLGSYHSRRMDISRLITTVSGKDPLARANYLKTVGALGSAMEGMIYEKLFGGKPGSGNSTVQLLLAANAAHIPLYAVSQDNQATALPRLKLSQQIMADITNAVNAGKVVITPESPITRFGWTGNGYLIQDPVTGEGAYLISGGANGNELVDCRKQSEPLTSSVRDYILTATLIAELVLAAIAVAGAAPEIGIGVAAAGIMDFFGVAINIKALMATVGLSSLVLSLGANASPNSYAYPAGTKICGGGDCGTPAMYRGATDACPWPNMDCIRDNDINSNAFGIENGIEFIDPTLITNPKHGISTFDKPKDIKAVTGGWYEYPEEEPTGIPVRLCVVAGAGGHWAWQPKDKMPTETFKGLLRLTHPKFNKVN
ncbi:transglutaminase domain-containing protein [Methylovulum miyakonense]|uniref:transglutaminase domain-containing protein n=1 Tax=Methylovulum miyakonense TaxID=645578 RepID=UPI00036C6DDF|nr:transglutaminase domain-containing protein [Methylovulum miyakonense]